MSAVDEAWVTFQAGFMAALPPEYYDDPEARDAAYIEFETWYAETYHP